MTPRHQAEVGLLLPRRRRAEGQVALDRSCLLPAFPRVRFDRFADHDITTGINCVLAHHVYDVKFLMRRRQRRRII